MHRSRFDSILNSQTSVAKKVFSLIPADKSWTVATICFEVRRQNCTTADRRAIEGAVMTLAEAGLLQEHPKGSYTCVTPHQHTAQVIHKDDFHPREPGKVHTKRLVVEEPIATISTPAPPAKPKVVESPVKVFVPVVPAPASPPVVVQTEEREQQTAQELPAVFYDRYLESQLGHVMTNLRSVASVIQAPMASLLLDALEDLRGLQRLIRQYPVLERTPEMKVETSRIVVAKPVVVPMVEIKPEPTGTISGTAEYRCWTNIRYNKKIAVDPRWQKSFEAFVQDVGYRPHEDARLLRDDKAQGWTKDNVQWKVKGKRVAFVLVKPDGWPQNAK